MRISRFDGARDNDPKHLECTWESFAAQIGPHDYSFSEKLSAPAFSPAEFRDGTERAKENVLRVHAFVADVDHVDGATAIRVLERVKNVGLAAVAYSTWRHGEDPWRFRVVNPLTRPVLPAEWSAFWQTMNKAYGGVCDTQCVDPSRLYFGPYAPRGTEDKNFFHVFQGVPIDVDKVLAQADPLFKPQGPLVLAKLTHEGLERYAKSLKRHKAEYMIQQGDKLTLVCKGEVFAESGERDDAIFRLACLLGERFPETDPKSIAVHFAPSLQLMASRAPDCPTVDDVEYKIARKQDEVRAVVAEKAKADEDQKTKRTKEAWGNCRATPYTPEEIEAFGDTRHKLVLQYDRAFYLFFNGGYRGPFTEATVSNASAIHLAPASTLGVQVYTLTDGGKQMFKPIKQLVDEYGTVADSVVVDLCAQRTTYDEKRRAVIEASCPLRPIKPTYHEDIDRWLYVLCWAQDRYYENLKTWLAVVTDLRFICSALFLTGRKSVGKSLLALGIARLWTELGPTPLECVFDTFNDQLAKCPFAFADEKLPTDFRGYTKNNELRFHVQALERLYKRKYLPNSKLVGAIRVMIAAHDKSILKTAENLSNNEVAGSIERFFYIPTNPESANFLAALRPTTHERGWVTQDKIAEHILWLRDNHKHASQGRFYVHVPDEQLFRSLATQSGVKGALCQWLVSYLLEPSQFHKSAYSRLYVRVKNGKLLANVRGILPLWDTYVGKNERCPTTGLLAKALGELSLDERLKYENKDGERTNYRVVDIENLVSWAEDNGFADREHILAALEKDTDES